MQLGKARKGGDIAVHGAGMTLDEVRADAFRSLSRGVADRRSAFRSPALGTVGLDGRPVVRTVVLRAFDAQARTLTVHSDVRAGKISEIKANPAVTLHVWDSSAQVQIRVSGDASMLIGEDARPDWTRLHVGSRTAYTVRPNPATTLADPATADAERLDEDAAFANFAVLRIRLTGLEWLHLGRDGHRRAIFEWTGEDMTQRWVVP